MLNIENYQKKAERRSIPAETLAKIQSLIVDLQNSDGSIRQDARHTLVLIGKPAVDPLIPLLKHPDDDVRWEAAKALAEIGDPRAASGLAELLLDHNFGVRWLGAEALIPIGRGALEPLLEKLTEHPESSWLRRGVLHILHDLAKKDPGLKKVLGPVITALEGPEPEIGCLGPAYAALDMLKGHSTR